MTDDGRQNFLNVEFGMRKVELKQKTEFVECGMRNAEV
jgi:hypothetical protein